MNQAGFDFTAARALRDDGIARAVSHAEADAPGWTEIAYNFLVRYAENHQRFQCWMANQSSKNSGAVPVPENEKAWAAPIRKALKNGVIAKDGFAPNPKRHATDAPVYRSLVFREAA